MRYQVISYAVTGVNNKVFYTGEIVTDEDLIFDRFTQGRPARLVNEGFLKVVEDKKKLA